jgi:hypothetical protein
MVIKIVSIFIGYHYYQVGAKNLDLPILLIKNWFDNPTIAFEAKGGPQDVA